MLIQEPIQASIWHCLNHYDYQDAIFLSERLYSELDSEESLFLLSTCYYRAGYKSQCYDLLKDKKLGLKSKFLFAKCCSDLNRLPPSESTLISSISGTIINFNESQPFALILYGQICQQTDRLNQAIECYKNALKLNPFLWSCFANLAGLGVELNVENIFQVTHLENFNSCHGNSYGGVDDGFKFCTPPTTQPKEEGILLQSNKNYKFRNLFTSTPMGRETGFPQVQTTPSSTSNDSFNYSPFLQMPENLIEPRAKKPCLRLPPWQQSSMLGQSPVAQAHQNVVRRSSRLFTSNNQASVKENTSTTKSPITQRSSTTPRTPNSKSPNRKTKLLRSNTKSTTFENAKNELDLSGLQISSIVGMQKDGAEGLMQLLRDIGKSYTLLQSYRCREALEVLNTLKPEQFNSGFVLGLIAKCHFEMGDYEESVRTYNRLRQREPYRLDGLEWMSTALWHLQREVELSSLAHDLMLSCKNHPATWIAAGNCFSLHKEHETSIKFFKRAIQIEPNFAYSYTLLGHEYVATEEHEKAMRCFRNASRIDPRHYNAWYGMGMIFYKQERFHRAEIYYNKAISIHPNNSVLLCHLGVVQHSLNKTTESIATFNHALKTNPLDPLCKFHRASVLFSINKLEEALEELEELKQIVPKESLVYFLVAKVYSKRGDTHKALLHFSWATDLDPKGANNQIKESIEPVLKFGTGNAVTLTTTATPPIPPSDEDEDGMNITL